MSKLLHVPSLGPIVGHTTTSSARIWARGPDIGDARTVAVAALFDNGRYVVDSARYFRLRREFDRTGATDFEGLKSDHTYKARIGCIVQDQGDPMDVADTAELTALLPPARRWVDHLKRLPEDKSLAKFSTFPDSVDNGFSFLFGSCRHPGFSSDRKRSDQIFRAMADACEGNEHSRARFVIMVGDQIYADLLNRRVSIGRADTSKEFHERYMEAFGTPNMRRLLRSVPNYMMLDDHEIEDNWVKGRIRKDDKRRLFLMAIAAFSSFQWYHGPRTFRDRLCYYFDYAGYPFFALDQRTQRIRNDDDKNLADNHLMGRPAKDINGIHKGQVDIFCDWLVEQQKSIGNRPKFVVSPSVFAPNPVDTIDDNNKWRSDSWPAFPVTRRQVLKTIIDNAIQNVVFLSGDIHCSNCAEIYFKNQAGDRLSIKAFSVTSSAFYWPFPFADGDPLDYVHDSEREGDGFNVHGDKDSSVVMHYHAHSFQQDNNYSQVAVTGSRLMVRTFDCEGDHQNEALLDLA